MSNYLHNITLPVSSYTLEVTNTHCLVRTDTGMLLVLKGSSLKEYQEELNTLKNDSIIGSFVLQMIEQSEEKFKISKNAWLVKKLTSYRDIKTNQCKKIINPSITGLPPVIRFAIP